MFAQIASKKIFSVKEYLSFCYYCCSIYKLINILKFFQDVCAFLFTERTKLTETPVDHKMEEWDEGPIEFKCDAISDDSTPVTITWRHGKFIVDTSRPEWVCFKFIVPSSNQHTSAIIIFSQKIIHCLCFGAHYFLLLFCIKLPAQVLSVYIDCFDQIPALLRYRDSLSLHAVKNISTSYKNTCPNRNMVAGQIPLASHISSMPHGYSWFWGNAGIIASSLPCV